MIRILNQSYLFVLLILLLIDFDLSFYFFNLSFYLIKVFLPIPTTIFSLEESHISLDRLLKELVFILVRNRRFKDIFDFLNVLLVKSVPSFYHEFLGQAHKVLLQLHLFFMLFVLAKTNRLLLSCGERGGPRRKWRSILMQEVVLI